MDALAVGEAERAAGHAHALAGKAHEMHLDAARSLVVDRVMGEAVEIEIAAELAIDALEQIEVEGSGHAAASL